MIKWWRGSINGTIHTPTTFHRLNERNTAQRTGIKSLIHPTGSGTQVQKNETPPTDELLRALEILSDSCVALLGEDGRILDPRIPPGLDVADHRLSTAIGSIAIGSMLRHPILVVDTLVVVLLARRIT